MLQLSNTLTFYNEIGVIKKYGVFDIIKWNVLTLGRYGWLCELSESVLYEDLMHDITKSYTYKNPVKCDKD